VLGSSAKLLSVFGNVIQNTVDPGSGSSSGREVANMGQGIMEGSRTLGKSLFKGVTGIVTSPLEGAERAGLFGFAMGVGRGLVGVPMQTIGGVISAAGTVTAGLDASMGKVRVWTGV
jgi:vacuolar protein sorting-associated protein 13A/C